MVFMFKKLIFIEFLATEVKSWQWYFPRQKSELIGKRLLMMLNKNWVSFLN